MRLQFKTGRSVLASDYELIKMGFEDYIARKLFGITRKACEKAKHSVCNQIFDDTLPDKLSEEKYQLMQTCASLLPGQYKLYKTRKCLSNISGFSNLWTDHGYELVDPNTFEFPGLFTDKMREKMTSVGKYQVVLFRKTESHQYVVAFRGTGINIDDFLTDIRFPGEVLHKSRRMEGLRDFVRALVNCVGAENVVLTGHSLGAGVSMIVGQRLHLDNIVGLKEFYFNLPHMSLERLVSEFSSSFQLEMCVFNTAIRLLELSEVKAKVCELLKRIGASVLGYDLNKGPHMKTFLKLRGWCPYLCINKYDVICSGYVNFFKKVEYLSGTTTLDNVTAVTAATYPLQFFFGLDAKPHLLFPSANLIITDKSYGPYFTHQLSHWPSLERSRIITYKQVRGFSGVNW